MNRLLILASMTLLFAGTAFAADGGALYKQYCAACHGQDGATLKGEKALKDQNAEEIAKKLQGYADGSYGGANKAGMEKIAKKLEKDLKDIAEYAGSLQ